MYWIYFTIQWVSILCFNLVGLWVISWWFLLLLIPFVFLRLDYVRVRIRTLTCCGSSPSTRKELIEACKGDVTVVGQGWHFFLKREPPSKQVVFTSRFHKPYKVEGKTYYPCGMTIHALAKLFKEKQAFYSLPSYENISLGAWIADWNHGSQGDEGQPSDHAFDKVDYIPKKGQPKQVAYSELNRADITCILGVSINSDNLNFNKLYEKKAMEITDDMSQWLQPCFQRVLFIGRKSIGVTWKSSERKASKWQCCSKKFHHDPHLCSRFCLWFQIDPLNYNDECGCCSLFNCFQENLSDYNSLVSNYHINRLVPYVATIMTVFTCSTYNFEIFVDLKDKFKNKEKELEFFNNLHTELRDIQSGRSELRYGSRYLFIDVSLKNGFERPFKVLRELGIKEYALHKGKYDPKVNIRGIKEINLQEFFNPNTIENTHINENKLRLRF